ncbi:hypothetical protein UlMin_024693 [Ulmus minor]
MFKLLGKEVFRVLRQTRGKYFDCVILETLVAVEGDEELKEWDQCLLMLGDAKVDEDGNVYDTKDCNVMYLDKYGEDREINISSVICFLRGKAYEALVFVLPAIKANPLCYEALECLIENHMLSSEEETSLLSSLHFGPEDGWLSSFYSCLIKKYDKEYVVEAKFKELEQESCNSNLVNHHSFKDLFHVKSTLVHLAAAMELDYSNELYLMPCNLVKDYPQKALSWFVVGCYYYCIKKYDQSLQYFRPLFDYVYVCRSISLYIDLHPTDPIPNSQIFHRNLLFELTRFFCPPEIPFCMASPTMVSLHTSSPKILKENQIKFSFQQILSIIFKHLTLSKPELPNHFKNNKKCPKQHNQLLSIIYKSLVLYNHNKTPRKRENTLSKVATPDDCRDVGNSPMANLTVTGQNITQTMVLVETTMVFSLR